MDSCRGRGIAELRKRRMCMSIRGNLREGKNMGKGYKSLN